MTALYDIVNPEELAAGIEAKLINVRESDDGQRIYNYSDAAMYTPAAWDNPAVRACRGLIVNPSGFVIARPWVKFFNHGQVEAGTLDLDAPVETSDKVDGSLGILHYREDGQPRVATRGSFESDQAKHATELLLWEYGDMRWPEGFTPLVEIVYPANRIVCDYGDADELILLGGVWIETGQYVGPQEAAIIARWPGTATFTFPYSTLRDALAAAPRPGAEGLCVRYLTQNRIVKIKQDDYVALHRIVTGLSQRTVWEHMINGGTLAGMLDGLPDELHPWTRDVWEALEAQTRDIETTARAEYLTAINGLDMSNRGAFAAIAKQATVPALLFSLYDGRDITPAIVKTLKPRGDVRAKPISEAVA